MEPHKKLEESTRSLFEGLHSSLVQVQEQLTLQQFEALRYAEEPGARQSASLASIVPSRNSSAKIAEVVSVPSKWSLRTSNGIFEDVLGHDRGVDLLQVTHCNGSRSQPSVREPDDGDPADLTYDENALLNWESLMTTVLDADTDKMLQSLVLKAVWDSQEDGDPVGRTSSMKGKDAIEGTKVGGDLLEVDYDMAGVTKVGDTLTQTGCMASLMIHPDGLSCLLWMVLGCVFIGYDILTIPLVFFDLPDFLWTYALRLAALAYWTLDVPINFLFGFWIYGVVEMRPQKVAVHYLKTWFFVDLMIVAIDWATADLYFQPEPSGSSTDQASGMIRMGKYSLRVSRILRVLRLIRARKALDVIKSAFHNLASEYFVIIAKLFWVLICILIINHYVACIWYALAFYSSYDHTWLDEFTAHEQTDLYKYLASLHWSLTQFTPATNNVVPMNSMERIYACCVVVFALVVFSSFVSSITGVMAQIASFNSGRREEEKVIREFLSRKRISLTLGHSIWNFFRKSYNPRKQKPQEEDIAFFAQLPRRLLMKLRTEVYTHNIASHPMIDHLNEVDIRLVMQICTYAMRDDTYLPGQDVFMPGERCHKVYFQDSGQCQYQSALHVYRQNSRVNPNDWLAEAGLWVNWRHRGRLTALDTHEMCSFAVLSITDFEVIATGSLGAYSFRFVHNYANKFVELANTMGRRNTPIDDLWQDKGSLKEIVTSSAGTECSTNAFSLEFLRTVLHGSRAS